MQGRKITAREFNHKKTAVKKPTVKVFSGKVQIDDPFLKIAPNTYRWYVLVPRELLSDHNWICIFRQSHKNRVLAGRIEQLDFDSYDLNSGAVLFAFK